MWQVWLAAAVAGSGYLVKHLHDVHAHESSQQTDQLNISPAENSKISQFSSPPPSVCSPQNIETKRSKLSEESIFRFSSAQGTPWRTSRRKLGSGSGGSKGTVEGIQSVGNEAFNKKFVVLKDGDEGFLVDHHKKIGKRFAVCLKKKRRTSKNASVKCEACVPKDDPSFSLGLGVGLMCLMSAGKSQISRLHTAMDDTTKLVQELKTEIAKRKSSRNDVLSLRAEGNADPKQSRGKHSQPLLTKSSTEKTDDVRLSGFTVSDEGECRSSVLAEEPQSEVLMDQLELELESELQKLPWCTTESSGPERSSDFFESEVSAKEFDKSDGQKLKSYQHIGVTPSELDPELCHVLIEQQESHIVELESELQQSHAKLNKKEAELQALKDCVRRLTKCSLASASDEESESQEKEEENNGRVHDSAGTVSKKSAVGIKRAMQDESHSYSCCTRQVLLQTSGVVGLMNREGTDNHWMP